jgi:hypothetical protein
VGGVGCPSRSPSGVSVSGSVSDRRHAVCVGDWCEQPAMCGALTPYAFRLPRTPHELAHALAHATREPAYPGDKPLLEAF